MNSMAHWLGGLVAVVVLCHGNIGAIAAQEAASPPPVSIVVKPASFANWTGEAHLTTTGSNLAVTRDTTPLWWGLGRGAAIGATAALTLTQAF